MDKISIDKLVVFGNHGVFEAENMLGQKFLVSVVVYTDTRKAGLTDDLACSVNYGDVSRDILKFFQNNTFKPLPRNLHRNYCCGMIWRKK